MSLSLDALLKNPAQNGLRGPLWETALLAQAGDQDRQRQADQREREVQLMAQGNTPTPSIDTVIPDPQWTAFGQAMKNAGVSRIRMSPPASIQGLKQPAPWSLG